MNKTNLPAALIMLLVCTWVQQAAAQETSPLRLSMNLLELEQAGGGTDPVARGTLLRVRGFGVFSDADGSVKWGDEVGGFLSDLDLEDVLGMDLETFTGGFLIGLNLGPTHVEVSYDGFYDYDGDKVVGAISVDGEVYTGRVQSSIDLHSGLLNMGWDFLQVDRFTVTGNLGLRIFHIDASITEVLTGRTDSVEFWAPIPTPGLAARVNLTDNLYISGSAAGIWLGSYGGYLEASAEIGYDFNRNLGVFVGYRFWGLDLDWDDNRVDLSISGVYAGVELRI